SADAKERLLGNRIGWTDLNRKRSLDCGLSKNDRRDVDHRRTGLSLRDCQHAAERQRCEHERRSNAPQLIANRPVHPRRAFDVRHEPSPSLFSGRLRLNLPVPVVARAATGHRSRTGVRWRLSRLTAGSLSAPLEELLEEALLLGAIARCGA